MDNSKVHVPCQKLGSPEPQNLIFAAAKNQKFGLHQNFDGLDQNFDGLDQNFDGFDQNFDGFDQNFDGSEVLMILSSDMAHRPKQEQ